MLDLMAAAQAGQLFTANTSTGTGIVCLAAMPTTAADWGLWNNNSSASGVCLVLVEVSAWIMSAGAGLGAAVCVTVGTQPQLTALTAYTNSVQSGLTGKLAGASKAIFCQGVTLAGASSWVILDGRDVPAAVEVGASIRCKLGGSIIVPPQYCAGGFVLAPTGATTLFGFSFTWQEVALTLS